MNLLMVIIIGINNIAFVSDVLECFVKNYTHLTEYLGDFCFKLNFNFRGFSTHAEEIMMEFEFFNISINNTIIILSYQ
jgi:hypothetical protein